MPTKETEATPTILALVCTCGNVMPESVRDPDTGLDSGKWCGHLGTASEVTFVPESSERIVDELHTALRTAADGVLDHYFHRRAKPLLQDRTLEAAMQRLHAALETTHA